MNIFLSGCTGKMGNTICDICKNSKEYKITAGYSYEKNDTKDFTVYTDISNVKEDFDIIIDFSSKVALNDVLQLALKRNKPVVLATTGFDEDDIKNIEKASKKIPILHSSNMSFGVNASIELISFATKILKNYDIEIIEKHHNLKKDSPSGTAKMMLNEIIKNRPDLKAVYGREGISSLRNENEIGVHSVRGGSIVGEHKVIFAGDDEIIEITHIANSKKIFANSALKLAKKLVGMPNGYYSIKDFL